VDQREELTFNEALHEYRIGGVVVPSVTQIIRPLLPDAYLSSDNTSQMWRGTVVHRCCQYDDDGELEDGSVDPAVLEYLLAWRKFRRENKVEISCNERPVAHRQLGYAGTPDKIAQFGGDVWILDIKTAADVIPANDIQLAAYIHAAMSEGLATLDARRAVVLLRDNGSYKLEEFRSSVTASFSTFLACLTLFKWRQNHAPGTVAY
jgi:hypothetical protein